MYCCSKKCCSKSLQFGPECLPKKSCPNFLGGEFATGGHSVGLAKKKSKSFKSLSLLFLGSKKVSGMLHRRRMSSCESSKRLSRSQSAKRYRKKSIIGLVLTVLKISGWAVQSNLLVINLKATESSRS